MATLTDLIESLLWEDESNTLDFKEAQYPFAGATDEHKSEIIKDILAFANAFRREDAYILLGVKDVKGGRGTITGVNNHLDDAHLQQLVNTKTNRPVEFSYHALEIDKKQVGAIRIPRQARPTYLRKAFGKLQPNTVYVRHGSSTSIATPEEISRMGTDHTAATHDPEIPALTTILHHARFYERVVTLIENISQLPNHYITNIAKPPSYEAERRPLHARFNEEHHTFTQAISSARDLLTEQQARVNATDAQAIREMLAAIRDVERSVSSLAQWANNRLDAIDTKSIPWDKRYDAEQAAQTLSTLVARRLLILDVKS